MRPRKIALTATVCCASAAVGIVGTSIATGASREAVEQPNQPVFVKGYGYTCDISTFNHSATWNCDYGRPYGEQQTPMLTVNKGKRRMVISSLRRPTSVYKYGEWTTTIDK